MALFNKNKNTSLKRDHTDSRYFSYVSGGTNLNFTLRTDIKTELKSFKDCLEAALEDVNAEIGKGAAKDNGSGQK
jgi:hypothetical protein